MKMRELMLKQTLAIRCTTCGSAPGKLCELSSGGPRNTSHRDRRLAATDVAGDERRRVVTLPTLRHA
jgi:hypothetical protein